MNKDRRMIRVGRRSIPVSSEEKVLFPESDVTKGQLIAYYQAIAPYMIPYMKDRPVTLQRFPEGIAHEGFFQKDASSYFPEWIPRVPVKNSDGTTTQYVLCNNVETLVYLTNQLAMVYHLWLSKATKQRHPDRLIFDLDPSSGVSFTTVRWVAKKIKELLDVLELPSYALITGSRGVHVVVPLRPVHTYERVHEFAHDCATLLSRLYPEKMTVEIRKDKRGKRVFIDYLRNTFSQTAVAPYSVRANKKAGIATPVTWEELLKKGIGPQQYTIKNIMRRVQRVLDPWADMKDSACTLSVARKRLSRFMRSQQEG